MTLPQSHLEQLSGSRKMGIYFSFENIGIFSEPQEIELKPLTVIAGENDTGKSTIGKLLFVLLKAHLMSSGGYFFKSWKSYLRSKTGDIKSDLQGILQDRRTYEILSHELDGFLGRVLRILDDRKLSYDKRRGQVENEIKKLGNIFRTNQVDLSLLSPLERSVHSKFREIHRRQTFYNLINHLFFGDFLSKLSNKEIARLKLKYLAGEIEAAVRGSYVEKFSSSGSLPFRDVTFVDTPVIFQLIKFLSEEEIVNIEYTPTIKDLRRKLNDREFPLTEWEKEELFEIVSNIQSIIRADIKQEKEGVFTLERGKLKIRLENAATGIKAFAVPLVLLKKGWLRKNTIFIIDEPEVHLHPIWQVRYAEILTMLVKRGVHVIATTHSPYVVKSIIKFSHEYGIRKNTVFYITKRIEDGAKIENADERLNEIFELFSRPMREVF